MSSRSYLNIILIIFLTFTYSCAKKIIPPIEQRLTPEEYIVELKKIKEMKVIFTANLKRGDETISGDASLKINGDETKLSIYSMGFLISEIKMKEDNIEIRGRHLNEDRGILLIEGLRYCFMWWNIEEMEIQKIEDMVILRNSWRKVFLERKSLNPLKQYIYLNKALTITITYSEPEMVKITSFDNLDSIWFPSNIDITIPQIGELTMKVKEIEI